MARIKAEDVYPITRRSEPGHLGENMTYISDEDLRNYTIPAELYSLYDFLSGQTRYLQGVYTYDVERWLNRKL